MTRILVDPARVRRLASGMQDDCRELDAAIAAQAPQLPDLDVGQWPPDARRAVRDLRGQIDRVRRAAAVAAWVADQAAALDRQRVLVRDSVVDQVLQARLRHLPAALAIDDSRGHWALTLLQALDSPDAVADLWTSLDPALQLGLERDAPTFVARTDGVPTTVRDRANRRLLTAHLGDLDVRARALDVVAGQASGLLSALQRGQATALRTRIADLRRAVDTADQLLLFDPAGDGRIVLVHGSLERADVVTVVVPGMTSSLRRLGMVTGLGHQMVAALDEVADAEAPGVRHATVVWLGYDAPSGLDALAEAAGPTAARDGAVALLALAAGIRTRNPDARIVAVGHSYGGLLSMQAAARCADDCPLDGVVMLGAPGIGDVVDEAGRLELPGDVGVHAAEAVWDGVPNLPVHGRNPVDVPGVEPIPMGAHNLGHGGYLTRRTEGARNVARVSLGLPTVLVEPQPHRRADPAPRPPAGPAAPSPSAPAPGPS